MLVHGGRIASIGTLSEVKRHFPDVKVVDFADALLVPLLVNAHTHLELTDFPQWAKQNREGETPKNFVDWILRLIRVKQKLQAGHYQASIKNGMTQSVAAGTGAVGDILAQHAARSVYQGSPLIGSLFLETLGHDPVRVRKIKNGLDEALDDEVAGSVTLAISPHSPYTISRDYLQQIYSFCQQGQLRCSTHLAESAAEVEFIERGCGDLVTRFYPFVGWERFTPDPSRLRPVEYLQQQGGLFPENLLVHGVHLSSSDIEILARKKMFLALCPRSNAKLNVGRAAAGRLFQAGVRLALGTDSLASCDSLSVWDEMAFAHSWFNGELDAPTLFNMATLGGAEALGVENELGSLAIGKAASFQVLRPKTIVAVPDVFDYFISSGCTDDIIHIYHRGQLQ